jgi:hypothetical protein
VRPSSPLTLPTAARTVAAMSTPNEHNTQGTPGTDEEADTASGGAPEEPDITTDEDGKPVDNPSGG